MPHSEKKAKKICGELNTYFYPQYSAPATPSGHIGPNEEKMIHNVFEEKAEKVMGGWEKQLMFQLMGGKLGEIGSGRSFYRKRLRSQKSTPGPV